MTSTGLFKHLLDADYDRLAPRVREIHGGAPQRLQGAATVTRGKSLAARLICRIAALPAAQHDVPVRIDLRIGEHGETWTRHFGSSSPMRSHLRSQGGLLVEQLGPVRLRFRLRAIDGAIDWQLQAVSLFGIPAPRRWLAAVTARSSEERGRYCFVVDVALPIVGHVIGYRGSVDAAH